MQNYRLGEPRVFWVVVAMRLILQGPASWGNGFWEHDGQDTCTYSAINGRVLFFGVVLYQRFETMNDTGGFQMGSGA